MAHHHKSNKAVEGAPYDEHGRGMPRRPDADRLERRVEADRQDLGLPGKPQSSAAQEDAESPRNS
ncbi:hypothetical protein [Streptomyces sp. NBC_00388]|uniref:hypothetical protein n=1 Tax=Streptomyces sp. NBC_00388 TaxID=2975735 RepID=UPI002E23F42B